MSAIKTYVERDVSWMYFNYRILQEAEKEYVPLLERLSFLGIYSNNLDEFFRVRVASLNRMVESDGISKANRNKLTRTLKTINQLNKSYSQEYIEATDHVFESLRGHGIRLLKDTELNDEQKKYLTDLFYDKLNGYVNPIWVDEIKDIAKLEDNKIYLLVEKTSNETRKKRYAIVKIPDRTYGRWIRIPSSDGFDNIMYLDDVIRFCMPLIFIGVSPSTYRAYSFKFTKDARWRSTTTPTMASWKR